MRAQIERQLPRSCSRYANASSNMLMRLFVAKKCYECKQYFATHSHYSVIMKMLTTNATVSCREAIGRNLKQLMADRDMDQVDVAKLSGVAQTTVSNLLRGAASADDTPSPNLKTLENIAAIFNIPAWVLLIPDIPLDQLKCRDLEKLVSCFLRIDADAKKNLLRLAENELRYITK